MTKMDNIFAPLAFSDRPRDSLRRGYVDLEVWGRQSTASTGNVVDEHGVSALMMAAFMGSNDACEVLLKKGAEVNHAERHSKRTALMMAAQGGHLDVVKTLLTSKADTTQVDIEMQTALHWAAVGGRTEVARLLAALGQKDAKNEQGETPAMVAEKMKHRDTAASLM
ncbi:secG [Symbiodinium natans]|uniref:SecG protein n=1 Tax=Symbiodinium natans TaxID=878477 RepID=A0A812I2L5_9DINO|nr:secG [Symbiodinium natans]